MLEMSTKAEKVTAREEMRALEVHHGFPAESLTSQTWEKTKKKQVSEIYRMR